MGLESCSLCCSNNGTGLSGILELICADAKMQRKIPKHLGKYLLKNIWSKPDNLTIILGVHKHQWSCKYHWRSHFIFNEVQYLPIQRNQFAVKFLRYNCFWLVLWDYMSVIWKTSDQRGSSFYCNGKKTCNFLLSRCIILIFNL